MCYSTVDLTVVELERLECCILLQGTTCHRDSALGAGHASKLMPSIDVVLRASEPVHSKG